MTGFSRLPGGPYSGVPIIRTREEIIQSTLLGKDAAMIRCPRVIRLALDFEGRPPVAALERLLDAERHASAEELRGRFEIPRERLLCRADPRAEPLKADLAPPEAVLRTALLLGLCTQALYDPARPVLWTEASLSRRLELFDPEGFYT